MGDALEVGRGRSPADSIEYPALRFSVKSLVRTVSSIQTDMLGCVRGQTSSVIL